MSFLHLPGMATNDDYDWQENKNVTQCNAYMLENEIECDIAFTLHTKLNGKKTNKIVKAHKYMLISRSSVFRAMLCGPLADTAQGDKPIDIVDIPVEAFRSLLKYIYTDKADLSEESVMAVLYSAAKYNMKGLTKDALRYLENRMNVENVCLILSNAYMFDEKSLMDKCYRFIDQDPRPVLQCNELKELPFECLFGLVSRETLQTSDGELWRAVLDWADHQCEKQEIPKTDANKRKVLGKILYEIRFPRIDPKLWENSGVLTDEEKANAREHQCKPQVSSALSARDRRRMPFNNQSPFFESILRSNYMGDRMMFRDLDMMDMFMMDEMGPFPGSFSGRRPFRDLFERPSRSKLFRWKDKSSKGGAGPSGSIFKTDTRKIIECIHRFQDMKHISESAALDDIIVACSHPIRLEGIGVFGKTCPTYSPVTYNWTVAIDDKVVRKETTRVKVIPVDRNSEEKREVTILRISEPLEIAPNTNFTIACPQHYSTFRGKDGDRIVVNYSDGVIFRFDYFERPKDHHLYKTTSYEGNIPVLFYSKIDSEYRPSKYELDQLRGDDEIPRMPRHSRRIYHYTFHEEPA